MSKFKTKILPIIIFTLILFSFVLTFTGCSKFSPEDVKTTYQNMVNSFENISGKNEFFDNSNKIHITYTKPLEDIVEQKDINSYLDSEEKNKYTKYGIFKNDISSNPSNTRKGFYTVLLENIWTPYNILSSNFSNIIYNKDFNSKSLKSIINNINELKNNLSNLKISKNALQIEANDINFSPTSKTSQLLLNEYILDYNKVLKTSFNINKTTLNICKNTLPNTLKNQLKFELMENNLLSIEYFLTLYVNNSIPLPQNIDSTEFSESQPYNNPFFAFKTQCESVNRGIGLANEIQENSNLLKNELNTLMEKRNIFIKELNILNKLCSSLPKDAYQNPNNSQVEIVEHIKLSGGTYANHRNAILNLISCL